MGKCKWKNDFEIEKILECKGPVCVRRYQIKWKGYQETTWEPRGNLHPEDIASFEKPNDCYEYGWAHRCPTCDLPFSSQRAIKIHMGRYHKPDEETKEQDFSNRLADRAVRVQKLKAQQSSRPAIYCNEVKLENVFNFVYLGTLLSADGNQAHDIKRRIALATTQCGKLRHIFDSNNITLHLKLRLYKAAVCSVLMFGCETWMFDMKTMRQINGINSLLLARITGNSAAHEARPATTSFNLVRQMRIVRYKYLGCLLRAEENRLVHLAVKAQHAWNLPGSLLMDAPPHQSFQHLRELAMDKAAWRERIAMIV